MAKTRARASIEGEVQGVGYRYSVASAARRFTVTGYVKNLRDGTVEVVAEGEEKNVKDFLEAVRIYEPPIVVENVKIEYGKPTGRFRTFEIITGRLKDEMVEGFGTGASYLKLIVGLQKETLGGVRETLGEIKGLRLGQDEILGEVKGLGKGQEEIIGEVRGLRQDLRTIFEERLQRLEQDVQKIKSKLSLD